MAGRASFQIPTNARSKNGGVGIPVTLGLSGATQVTGDFGVEQGSDAIDFVQSVYIDNSLNTKAVTIVFPGTKQSVTVKANTQGYYPIIPQTGLFSWIASAAAGSTDVLVIFTNQKYEAAQWATV